MARLFDGDSSEKGIYSGAVVAAMPFSMGCRFYATPGHGGLQNLLSIANGSDNFFRLLYDNSGSGDLTCGAYDGGSLGEAAAAGGSVGSSIWHSLLAVFGSTTSRDLYTNAVKTSNTTSVNPSFSGSVTAVGCYSGSVDFRFIYGRIAEVAFWSGALVQADADMLNAGFSPALVRPDLLAAYYPLIGRTSPEIELRNRFELTLTGTAAIEHPRVIYRRRCRAFFGTAGVTATPQSAYPIADIAIGGWQAKGPGYETLRNLLTYTESFDNGAYTTSQATISPNTATSTDGTLTADSLVDNTNATTHYLNRVLTLTANLDYTLFFDVRANVQSWCEIQIATKSGNNYVCYFNLAGSLGTDTFIVASEITLLTNGYYRCAVHFNAETGGTTPSVYLYSASANNGASYAGTGGNAIDIAHVQLVQDTAAGAYQPILATTPPLAITSTLYPAVADGSTGTPIDTDYIYVTLPGSRAKLTLTALSTPTVPTDPHIYSVRADSAQSRSGLFELVFGGVTVATRTQAITPTPTTYPFTLTAPEIALIPVGGYATPEAWVTGLA